MRGYVIATAPRSGSTLLCEMLRATGVAGRPGSHLHQLSLQGWLTGHGLKRSDFASDLEAARAVIDMALAKGRDGGDVFGLRLQGRSLGFLMEQLAQLHADRANDGARMEAAFGPLRYIHLRREDKVAQAVSRALAEQTGLWHRAADGSEWERSAPHEDPTYDRDQIAAYVAEADRLDCAWEDWFDAQGIAPLSLSYEAFAAAPTATLARVLQHLDLPQAGAAEIAPPMQRMANATNRDWVARFHAEEA